jgi:hypothetical protein
LGIEREILEEVVNPKNPVSYEDVFKDLFWSFAINIFITKKNT